MFSLVQFLILNNWSTLFESNPVSDVASNGFASKKIENLVLFTDLAKPATTALTANLA